MKRVRRARGAPAANRPWTEAERQVVLTQGPPQIRIPVALGMFTGLRKGVILKLTKIALRNGQIWRRTSKTGQEVSIPIQPDLAQLLAADHPHDAVTIAVTTNGTPWTISGFNSTFIKAIAKLQDQGLVGEGLTFHGLRHTVAQRIREDEKEITMAKRATSNGRDKRVSWTTDHVRELKQHSKSKTPVAKIAKGMKRSEGAIRQKALALDISIGHRR